MLLYIIIAGIVNVEDPSLLLDAGRCVLFFVFSCMLSGANVLLRLDKMGTAVRVLLHYLMLAFAVYACFMLPLSMRGSSIFIGLVIFSVIYAATMGVIAAVRARYKKITEEDTEYQRLYTK